MIRGHMKMGHSSWPFDVERNAVSGLHLLVQLGVTNHLHGNTGLITATASPGLVFDLAG